MGPLVSWVLINGSVAGFRARKACAGIGARLRTPFLLLGQLYNSMPILRKLR